MPDELDNFGIFVVALIAVALSVAAIILIGWNREVQSKRAAYEQCVASISQYIDAQETLYQQQECKNGVAP